MSENNQNKLMSNKFFLLILFGVSIIFFILVATYSNDDETTNETYLNENLTPEQVESYNPNTLNVSIASEIYVNTKDYEGTANIKNIGNYEHYFIVEIALDGETIYTSNAIQPDETVKTIQLNKEIETGRYPINAYFNAYNKETNQLEKTINFEVELAIVNML